VDPVDLTEVLARWERGELGAVAASEDVSALRGELESVARAASAMAGDLSSNPIRLSKRRITDLLACERHLVATVDDGADGEHVHLGVLVDALAEHRVVSTRARLEPEPLELAVDLCRARGDDATVAWVEALAGDARRAFADRLEEKRTTLLRRWPAFDPAWWARTQERVEVGLADGEVVLSGRADVTVGGPPTPQPVLVIEVKSGSFSIEQRDDGLVYALLLALRDGVAPAAAVTVTAAGAVHVEVATGERLATAALRVEAAVRAAGELAAGRPPIERPGARCDRCPVRRSCTSALAVA
jgi:CRISPR/Cas system-associated exonuclease Cas4 (RecB family)